MKVRGLPSSMGSVKWGRATVAIVTDDVIEECPLIAKRARGRPSFTGKPVKRYQITIPPATANRLRHLGKGSLSAGIILAEKEAVLDKQQAHKREKWEERRTAEILKENPGMSLVGARASAAREYLYPEIVEPK
jgi:hypothetical protein